MLKIFKRFANFGRSISSAVCVISLADSVGYLLWNI